jgi:hypothetical protein
MRHKQHRLNIDKLMRFTGAASNNDLGVKLGIPERTVAGWAKEGGVPDMSADNMAIKLGVHPSAIWGDEWFALADQPVAV